jgi:hypothetical protein
MGTEIVMTSACPSHNALSKPVEMTAPIHTAILPHAVAILVLIDYAMLSWFGTFAEWTGNTTGMFKVGTGLFLGLNVAMCVACSCDLWNEDRLHFAQRERRMGLRFLVMTWGSLVVLALSYRISAIIRTPMDPAVADMLPVIIQAGQKILAGQDPYTIYHLVSHDTPMQWLPALWLPYVPSVWLGMDPRYFGLAAVIVSAGILGLADWTIPGNGAIRTENQVHPWVRIGLAGGLLLTPAAVWFGAIGHTQVYWLYLIGFVWSLSRRWWSWAGVCLGLCLMSRHTLLPLLPLIGLYLFRCLDKSAKTRLGLSAAATVLAILLPFGLNGMRHLFVESPEYYWLLGQQAWTTTPWWVTNTFGLGVFLYPAGYGSALSWVGGLCLMAVYGLAGCAIHDERTFVACLTLGLLMVTVSVPTPFRYEFIPIVILLSTIPLLQPKVAE